MSVGYCLKFKEPVLPIPWASGKPVNVKEVSNYVCISRGCSAFLRKPHVWPSHSVKATNRIGAMNISNKFQHLVLQLLNPVWFFATPWTVPTRLLCPWVFPGKEFWSGYPPGIFLTQGTNPCLPCLLHWQAGSLPLSHQESPSHHLLLESVVQH